MKFLNMKSAIKRYNNIMSMLCYEHLTIGTNLSEDTEGWTIRDMVAECDYVLSTYYEGGHVNGDLRYGDAEERAMWRRETGFLKRFIKTYEPFAINYECVSGHCSKYD